MEESCSAVVTVAMVKSSGDVGPTTYTTGFILIAEEKYCLVFTSLGTGHKGTEYFVLGIRVQNILSILKMKRTKRKLICFELTKI